MTSQNKYSDRHTRKGDGDALDVFLRNAENKSRPPKVQQTPPDGDNRLKRFLKVAVILLLGFFFLRAVSNFNVNIPPITQVFSSVVNAGPSEDLLNRMNARMVEMGYDDLSHDDLRELRSEGVTATYISNVRSLGYTDMTLDEAVRLANAGASSTFIAMMQELGYDLTLDELVELRRAGVTAHYTSNIHDLGYTDVTTDQLLRMRRIGVTPSLVERLQEERGSDISMEEIIRYRISN